MLVSPWPVGFHTKSYGSFLAAKKWTSETKNYSLKGKKPTTAVFSFLSRSTFSPQDFCFMHMVLGVLFSTRTTFVCGSPLSSTRGRPMRHPRRPRSSPPGVSWPVVQMVFARDPDTELLNLVFFFFFFLLDKINRGDFSKSPDFDTGLCMFLFCELVSLSGMRTFRKRLIISLRQGK